MTQSEYEQKRKAIATSDAPISIKEKAMKDLEAKYQKKPTDEARKQFLESSADISDLRSAYE